MLAYPSDLLKALAGGVFENLIHNT